MMIMTVIYASFAIILCWIWIELFISLALIFNKKKNSLKQLSVKKFKRILRAIILILFSLVIIYMYLFENEELQKTISLCLGIIR